MKLFSVKLILNGKDKIHRERYTVSSFNNISASLCHPSYNSFTPPFTQRRAELSGLSPGTISVLWNLLTFGKFWLSAKLARGYKSSNLTEGQIYSCTA